MAQMTAGGEWIRTVTEYQAMTRAFKRFFLQHQPTETELRIMVEWAERQRNRKSYGSMRWLDEMHEEIGRNAHDR